jgi:hypothetical protein
MKVIENNESSAEFFIFKFSEVNLFKTECSHGTCITKVRSALGEIFVEWQLFWFLVLEMITNAS